MKFYNDKLVYYRKKSYLTVRKIIQELGVCRATYWKWEKGVSVPKKKQIYTLAKILEISVAEISDFEQKHIAKERKVDFSTNVDALLSFLNIENNKNIKSVISNALNGALKLNDKLQEAGVVVKAILSGLDSKFYIKDSELKYITANLAFLEGVSLDSSFKVYGCNDNDFFVEKEAKENNSKDEKVFIAKEAIVEEGFIPGSRKKRWGIISRTPVLNDQNEVLGVITNFVDITDRKKAETTAYLLEQCIGDMTEGVVIFDFIKQKNVYLNKSVAEILDCPIDVLYKTGREHWLNVNLSQEEKKYVQEINKKKSWPKCREIKIKCRKNVYKWVEVKNSFIELGDGGEYVISILSDITERKNSERSLKELEFAIDKVDEGIWTGEFTSDDESSFQFNYINRAVENIFGVTRSNIKKNILKWVENPDLWAELSKETKKKNSEIRKSDAWPRIYDYKARRKSDNQDIWIKEKIYRHDNTTFGVIKDKTEIGSLNEYKEILFSFFDGLDFAPCWLVELSPIYRFLYANRSYENLVQRNIKDFYNKPGMWKTLIYPPDLEKVMSREFLVNEPGMIEYRVQQPDGTIVPVIEKSMKLNHFGKNIIGGIILKKELMQNN